MGGFIRLIGAGVQAQLNHTKPVRVNKCIHECSKCADHTTTAAWRK